MNNPGASPTTARVHLAAQDLLLRGHGRVQPRVLAARWRGWAKPAAHHPDLTHACHHGGAVHVEWDGEARRCGKPWADHAWCGDTLVCPGDWVVTAGSEIHALTPPAFHARYDPAADEHP